MPTHSRVKDVLQLEHAFRSLADAATIVQFQQHSMELLGQLFGSTVMAFFHWVGADQKPASLQRGDLQFLNLDREFQETYYRQVLIAGSDPLMQWRTLELKSGIAMNLRRLCSDDTLKRSQLYQMILKPNGLGDVLTVGLRHRARIVANISFARRSTDPDFSEKDLRIGALLGAALGGTYTALMANHTLLSDCTIKRTLERCGALERTVVIDDLHGVIFCSVDIPSSPAEVDSEAGSWLTHLLTVADQCRGRCDAYFSQTQADVLDLGVIDTQVFEFSRYWSHKVARINNRVLHVFRRIEHTSSVAMTEHSDRFGLTKREVQIAQRILQGMSISEIGTALSISKWTVKNHLQAIYSKTGVSNRMMLSRRLGSA